MFRVEYAVHLKYAKGRTTFRREQTLPFAPFIGLDILDDALGEFKLEHVAWCHATAIFLCQAQVSRTYWTLRTACSSMQKAKWEEDKDAREPNIAATGGDK